MEGRTAIPGCYLTAMVKGLGCHQVKERKPSPVVFHFKQGIQEFSLDLMSNRTAHQNNAYEKEKKTRRLSSEGPVQTQLPHAPFF